MYIKSHRHHFLQPQQHPLPQPCLLIIGHKCFSCVSWFSSGTFLHSSPGQLLPWVQGIPTLWNSFLWNCWERASVICEHLLFLICWESMCLLSSFPWQLLVAFLRMTRQWMHTDVKEPLSEREATEFLVLFLPNSSFYSKCSPKISDQTISTETSTFE